MRALNPTLARLTQRLAAIPQRTRRGVATGVAAAVVATGGAYGTWATWIRTEDREAVIGEKRWERQIEIEQFRTIQDRDWRGSEPDDARVYDERREVHHYEQRLSHYRTVTESYSCGTYEQPRTCTRSHQEPVYVSEPVYRTRLYYEVDRWVTARWVVAEGRELAPAWPALPATLNVAQVLGNEREGDERQERYELDVICDADKCDDTLTMPQAEWELYQRGQPVIAAVTARGNVRGIDPVP